MIRLRWPSMARLAQRHERRSPSHDESELVRLSQTEILSSPEATICAEHTLADGEAQACHPSGLSDGRAEHLSRAHIERHGGHDDCMRTYGWSLHGHSIRAAICALSGIILAIDVRMREAIPRVQPCAPPAWRITGRLRTNGPRTAGAPRQRRPDPYHRIRR
jgi:hypothetical protein